MIIKDLTVQNELGIHARVATKLVRCAKAFQSSIHAIHEGKSTDIKNVIGIMMLNAKFGQIVKLEIDGIDEEAAALEMEKLFADKFGEK